MSRTSPGPSHLPILLLLGALSTAVSLVLAVWLRLGAASVLPYLATFKTQALSIVLIYTGTLYVLGATTPGIRQDRALAGMAHLLANAAAWILSLSIVYLQGLDRIGRGIFVLFGATQLVVSGVLLASSGRLTQRFATLRRAIIVGAGESAVDVVTALRNHPAARLAAVAIVHLGDGKTETDIVPVFSGSAVLHQVAVDLDASYIILAPPYKRDDDLVGQLLRCRLDGMEVIDAVHLHETFTGRVPLQYVDDHWALYLTLTAIKPIPPALKRMVDIIGSTALLAVTAPVMLIVAALIRLSGPGPILYRQERLGLHSTPFEVIKFRTMVPDAEATTGAVWATKDDPRVTRLGRFLRRTRLDELPQLINVLRGDMSLVGPRPEREVFVAGFMQRVPVVRSGRRKSDPEHLQFVAGFRETINLYSARLLVKPGLTGWAQVAYRYAASLEDARAKFEYDLYYIKNQSMLFDLAIILRTVWMVVNPKGW
jgi:lipopolysaccharide/colanic/teichoic acid biosynthesis glycosyltransferase